MAVQAEFRWLSSFQANRSCKLDFEFFDSDCNSYVRLVLPHNDSYYLVCASSAKMPTCRPLTLAQVSVIAILLLPNFHYHYSHRLCVDKERAAINQNVSKMA